MKKIQQIRSVAAASALHSFCFSVVALFANCANAEDAVSHSGKNHLSFLTGTSYVAAHDAAALTLGVDFEREVSHKLGIGVVAEHALGELDATSVFAVADVHLGRDIVFQLGPGVEFIDDRTLAVGRLGLFQELHFGEMVVAPSLSYDFTKAEDTLVFALAIGSRF